MSKFLILSSPVYIYNLHYQDLTAALIQIYLQSQQNSIFQATERYGPCLATQPGDYGA